MARALAGRRPSYCPASSKDGSWQESDASALLNCDATGELAYHLAQYCTELAAGQSRTS